MGPRFADSKQDGPGLGSLCRSAQRSESFRTGCWRLQAGANGGTSDRSGGASPSTGSLRGGLQAHLPLGRLAAAAALLAVSACAYIDPVCLFPGQGAGWRPKKLLSLDVVAPAGSFQSFKVNLTGGVTYMKHEATLCDSMNEGQMRALAEAWTVPELESLAAGTCGPGWSFGRLGDGEACPGAREWELGLRRSWGRRISLDMRLDGVVHALTWDLEEPLPPELEAIVADTLSVACTESGAFRRRLRSRVPELAAMAQC